MVFTTDITVIGAGPVGLFTVFQAGMLKLKCNVIDSLDYVGGQCTALYPEKPIFDIPAHPKITAGELVTNLEIQATPFHPHYHLGHSAITINRHDNNFHIQTDKGVAINSKVIIIAAGCGAFGPNRPPLASIEDYEGKTVFYMVQKKENFRAKKIVIAGGGDSAVDWAVELAGMAEKIYMVHRRDKFRCAPASYDLMLKFVREGAIELVTPYQLEALEGKGGMLEAVTVKDFSGGLKTLEADILLPFFGLSMELGPINDWNLALEKKHIKVDPCTMATSEKGIFAVGDIATYPGKLKLILTGFAEAANACHNARKEIFPDQEFHFEYSTTHGVPLT